MTDPQFEVFLLIHWRFPIQISTLRLASRKTVYPSPYISRRRYYNTYGTSPHVSKAIVGGTIVACVGIYAYMRYSDELAKKYRNFGPIRWLNNNFTCSMRNFREGRYWTLLTYTLMHGSIGHLAFNMFGLYSFGPMVVLRYGVPAYFALWVGAGLTGAVCELYFTKEMPGVERYCVGASGSILGIVTVNAFAAPKSIMMIFPIPFPIYNWIGCLGFAAYSVYAQNNGLGGNTGHLGHLGGMVFGAAYWLLALRNGSPFGRSPRF